MRLSGHSSQRGERAPHSRRPWRISAMCDSYGSSRADSRSSSSWHSSSGAPGTEQAQARANPVHVGVHGHVVAAEREQQHAGRRLAAHAGQRAQLVAGLRQRLVLHARQVVVVQRVQDRADAWRLGRRQPAGPDGLDHLLLGRVAHLGPRLEPPAQPLVGHVAVAVVGVLGEHREHQLVDRSVVGLTRGVAVGGRQPLEDGAQPPRRRALPKSAAISARPRAGGHGPAGRMPHADTSAQTPSSSRKPYWRSW